MVRNSRNYNFISTDKPMLGVPLTDLQRGGDKNDESQT